MSRMDLHADGASSSAQDEEYANEPMKQKEAPQERPSRCFPLQPFKCLPGVVLALIPNTWQKIQDCTHFTLVLGVLACIALVLQSFITMINGMAGESCWGSKDGWFCSRFWLAIVFAAPVTGYNFRIIGQYDDKLQAKQKQAKEEKENLTKSYQNLLSDMDGLLAKSAESASGLAERSFESKRRDFQRFLERAKQRYSTLYTGVHQGDSQKLFEQFRLFCINWLHVFQECSIDPIECPKRVVTKEELDRCTTVTEVADLCLERLRVTEVRFISIQRDQDAQMLRKQKGELRRLTVNPDQARQIQALADMPAAAPAISQKRALISWIQCGGGHGCRCHSSSTSDGFPKECRFGCGRIIVLSKEHSYLMMGMVVGVLLLLLEIAFVFVLIKPDNKSKLNDPRHTTTVLIRLVCIFFAQLCVFMMLIKFEELDVIQQLEREVKELARQNQAVEKQRERMREFWSNAQQLTELWLYRTVPRLDLYKELHSQLEDAPQEELLSQISGANRNLKALEDNLGDLQAWRNDGALKPEDKKKFGKEINALCQEQDFGEMLFKLEEVTTSGMSMLKALPPPQSMRASGGVVVSFYSG